MYVTMYSILYCFLSKFYEFREENDKKNTLWYLFVCMAYAA